ncbi:MAG TPA: FecR family protein [Pirellulaceae bacterium]|nr:FecR family protein [Pirellulaceae bacterium]
MNENHQHAGNGHSGEGTRVEPLSLWSRWVAGDPLGSEEMKQLQTALREDLSFRQAVMNERRVERLLRFDALFAQTEAFFAAGVLKRCREGATANSPGDSAGSNTIPNRSLSQPHPIEINVRPRAWRDSQTRRRLADRKLPARLALAAVALLMAGGVGLGWWFRAELSSGAGAIVKDDSQHVSPQPSGDLVNEQIVREPSPNLAEQLIPEKQLEPAVDLTHQSPDTRFSEGERQPPVFATLTGIKRATEGGPFSVGTTFGDGDIRFESGDWQLTMTSGAVVEVFGPSRLELLSDNSLMLIEGELSATVPTSAQGFYVLTPSVMVIDLGTVFDVAVHDQGTTEVEVRQGRVAVSSREPVTQQQWHLDADGLYQLAFYSLPPSSKSPESQPIASLAKDQSGHSAGAISLDGRTIKFNDEIVFATVRDQVFQGILESPEHTASSWKDFVDSTASQPEPSGSVLINGVQFEFGNWNEAILAQHRLRQLWMPPYGTGQGVGQPDQRQLPQGVPPGMGRGSTGFRGTLMINGQERSFESAEQYQAAVRELLGPAAEFGFRFDWQR